MADSAPSAKIPVSLLSQTLIELRQARGNAEATREAAIRYFKGGLAGGYQVGPLLNWLLLWPSTTESVFWQVRYPGDEGKQFIDMLKKMSLQDLGLDPADIAALEGRDSPPSEPQS
jgi:hypothetical protein